MTIAEQLSCLTDRPCDVCKFHTENGCDRWECVFEEEPDDCEYYEKERGDMTREEAIKIIREIEYPVNGDNKKERDDAVDMAIKALENIGHLTDRPCEVCEYHKENGCSQWICVFTDKLFGDMR